MKKNSFAPVFIVLAIVVLGAVGYRAYSNYFKKHTSLSTPTPTTFPTKLRDSSLENYLKKRLDACVQYQGENFCDPNANEATIQKIDGDYAFGGFGNGQVGFWFGVAKVNGIWSYFIYGNGIPDCSEVEIFPPTSLNSQFDVCGKGSTVTIYRSTGKTL